MGQWCWGRPIRGHQRTSLRHWVFRDLILWTLLAPLHSWGPPLCLDRAENVAGTIEVRGKALGSTSADPGWPCTLVRPGVWSLP